MKRILMINYEYPPVGGGAGNATFFILNELLQQDIAVDLITSSPDNSFHVETLSPLITVYKVPVGLEGKEINYGSYVVLLRFFLQGFYQAFKLVRKSSYDMVHSFFGVPCGFIALLLRFFYRVPYIVSLRGADVPGYKERYAVLDKYFFWWLDRYFIWRFASHVVSNSQMLTDLAHKSAPHQLISVIPNGVDVVTFSPGERSLDTTIQITAGWTRLEERKQIDVLIRSFALFQRSYSNSKLLLLGTGKELQHLKTLATDLGVGESVTFYEIAENTPENRAKVAHILSTCHIFCLPSKNEGMSNAVLEAAAAGLPLLLTAVGGTQELLIDSQNGYVIDGSNIEDIVEKMLAIIKTPRVWMEMSEKSRKIAASLSWQETTKKYLELYNE